MLNKILKTNLFLFDGEGAPASAEAGTASSVQGETGSNLDAQLPWNLLKKKPTGLDELIGEKQENTAEGEPANAQGELKQEEKAEKTYTQKDVDAHVKRRLKSANTEIDNLKKSNGKMQEVIDYLAQKYPGVDKSDMGALLEAVKSDESILRQKAIDNGTSVEQERSAYENSIELRKANQRIAELEAEKSRRATKFELNRQSQELRSTYPDFDLNAAMENDRFIQMLAFTKQSEGVENVRAAYEFAFSDQLRKQAIQQTVDKTKAAISQNRKAKQYMPSPPGSVGSNTKASTGEVFAGGITPKELADMALRGIDISKYLM